MPRTTRSGDGANEQPKDRRVGTSRRAGGSNGGANTQTIGGGSGADSASNDEIERRAYEIYQARGGEHGNDLDHWLEAERQLKPGPTSVTGSIGGPTPKKGKKPEADA